jgi:hypothetical protein
VKKCHVLVLGKLELHFPESSSWHSSGLELAKRLICKWSGRQISTAIAVIPSRSLSLKCQQIPDCSNSLSLHIQFYFWNPCQPPGAEATDFHQLLPSRSLLWTHAWVQDVWLAEVFWSSVFSTKTLILPKIVAWLVSFKTQVEVEVCHSWQCWEVGLLRDD